MTERIHDFLPADLALQGCVACIQSAANVQKLRCAPQERDFQEKPPSPNGSEVEMSERSFSSCLGLPGVTAVYCKEMQSLQAVKPTRCNLVLVWHAVNMVLSDVPVVLLRAGAGSKGDKCLLETRVEAVQDVCGSEQLRRASA